MRSIKYLAIPGIALAFCTGTGASLAQNYPSKPLRIIVPFAPGGTTDILARVLSERLFERWGQQAVIDNRAGAGGNIGTELVARAAPDGYTMLLGTMGIQSVNINLFAKLPFDPINDFAPVSLLAYTTTLLVLHPSMPTRSVRQLIALAQARPGQLNFSGSGVGTINTMSAEMFKMAAKVNAVVINYKGGAPALTAVMSGETNGMFLTVAPALPLVKSGRLRAVAVGAAKRHPLLPEVPTVSESGLPGFDISSWYGVLLPAGTPKSIVGRLNEAIAAIVKNPIIYQQLLDIGVEPVSNTPEQFLALVQADTAKWAPVARATDAKQN
ncbi:MAG: tripartite tricarboxylate transporter substrate binding protein [Betaproteobacteria bacterium]|nr:tripartite tricarboxylate transporter substrate binding protein [Betaproteobacteria bacterium]